ncbi:neutral amino acid transporter [Dinochytrium kinnereticum]|nr:neutral amino acid transporter [Dinochytrium kinnereticum]
MSRREDLASQGRPASPSTLSLSSDRSSTGPGRPTTPTPSIRKRSSYGALIQHHHTTTTTTAGSSVGSNNSSSIPVSRRSSVGPQVSGSYSPIVVASSLPRAIPTTPSTSGAYRIPLQDEPNGVVNASSFKKSFSPGKSLGSNGSGLLAGRPGSPSPIVDAIGEREAARIVSEHLVEPTELVGGADAGAYASPKSFGSISHNLLGGAVTRDIYQWKEKRMQPDQVRRRRNSEPDLSITRRSPDLVTASELREPGMFRRHFVSSRAELEGRQANIFTRNFIDFLLIYGFYGGDVVPDDEEFDDHDHEDVERVGGGGTPGLGGGSGGGGEGSGSSENTPLLGGSTRSVMQARPGTATPVHGTSSKKAFFMLMKAFVGTGVLFLPKAFSNGGMGFSIILLLVIGWLTLHCMLLLVETSRTLGGSFGDIGEKLYGPGVRQLVLWSIAVSQAGFACAYFIFVSQNLRDLLMILSDCRLIYPDWVFLLLQLLIYIPLSWVRRIKHFSVPSLIADVFILMGLAYIFYHDLTVLATDGVAPNLVWFNLESFSLFVGTAMFAFEGICLILPIAESMKHPEKFGWVLTLCIVVIGTIFIVIGAMGYLAFGSKVETVIFLNLPKGSGVVMGLQFFYAVAIMLSFPLTVYPSVRIIEAGLFGVRDGKLSSVVKWQKNSFRAFFVGFLAVVAWAGSNNLDKFVSLVGCFACVPLSFIYPALFHYHIAKSTWVKVKDIAIVIFGIIALFYTTYVTIQQWVVAAPDLPIDRCVSPVGRG